MAFQSAFKTSCKQNFKRFDDFLTKVLNEFDDGIFKCFEDYVETLFQNFSFRVNLQTSLRYHQKMSWVSQRLWVLRNQCKVFLGASDCYKSYSLLIIPLFLFTFQFQTNNEGNSQLIQTKDLLAEVHSFDIAVYLSHTKMAVGIYEENHYSNQKIIPM